MFECLEILWWTDEMDHLKTCALVEEKGTESAIIVETLTGIDETLSLHFLFPYYTYKRKQRIDIQDC
jgi:hypothetical protein